MTAHERTDLLIKQLEKEIDQIYAASEPEVIEMVKVYLEQMKPKIIDLVKRYDKAVLMFKSSMVILLTSSKEFQTLVEYVTDTVTEASEMAYKAFYDYQQKIYKETYFEELQEARNDFSELAFIPLMAISAHEKLDRKKERRFVKNNFKKSMTSIALTASVGVHPDFAKYGYPVDQAVKAFADKMATEAAKHTIKRSKASTRACARTRMTYWENRARQTVYNIIGKFGVKVRKVWITQGDERVRQSHAAMEGQTVDYDQPFTCDGYELMFPGDPSAPPELIYNCRCYMRRERR